MDPQKPRTKHKSTKVSGNKIESHSPYPTKPQGQGSEERNVRRGFTRERSKEFRGGVGVGNPANNRRLESKGTRRLGNSLLPECGGYLRPSEKGANDATETCALRH